MWNPFSDEEHSYATDGRIAVRVARRDDAPVSATAPLVSKVFEQYPVVPTDTVTVEIPEDVTRQCRDCNGSGEHECDCGDRHDCRSCGASGEVTDRAQVVIGAPRMFYAHLLRRCMRLPNFKMALTGEQYRGAYFTFDGGDGIVMPCRRDDDD